MFSARIQAERAQFEMGKSQGKFQEIVAIDFSNPSKIIATIKPEYMMDFNWNKIVDKEYKLELDLSGYPMQPPQATFINGPQTHLNVYRSGKPCLGGYQWSPVVKLVDYIQTIILLLKNPNPDDAANPRVANPQGEGEEKRPPTDKPPAGRRKSY